MPTIVTCSNLTQHRTPSGFDLPELASVVVEHIRNFDDPDPTQREWLLADPMCQACLNEYTRITHLPASDVIRISAIRDGESYPAPRYDHPSQGFAPVPTI